MCVNSFSVKLYQITFVKTNVIFLSFFFTQYKFSFFVGPIYWPYSLPLYVSWWPSFLLSWKTTINNFFMVINIYWNCIEPLNRWLPSVCSAHRVETQLTSVHLNLTNQATLAVATVWMATGHLHDLPQISLLTMNSFVCVGNLWTVIRVCDHIPFI